MDQQLSKNQLSFLCQFGWVIIPNWLGDAPAISKYVISLDKIKMRQAGIGRDGVGAREDLQVRGDKILWLQSESNPAVVAYLCAMESLRLTVNELLFLGLFDYECHFAHYAPGAFYQKHRDAFSGGQHKNGNRKLSSVFYLNENWGAEDGGELVLYDPNSGQEIIRILPELGTLVLFLSEEFPHEVLPAKRERWSLTGWFRSRPEL